MPTSKPPKRTAFEKYVLELVKYFQDVTNTSEYRPTVIFMGKPCKHQKYRLAEIGTETRYLEFVLRVYPLVRQKFEDGQLYEVVETICHEICHILTEPLYELAIANTRPSDRREIEDVRERQTQRICNALMKKVPPAVFAGKVPA
jgi:hypothetical protein